jgi:hypothetical protein
MPKKPAQPPTTLVEIKRHGTIFSPCRYINAGDNICYILGDCGEEIYHDIKEIMKTDMRDKVITTVLNIDVEGNFAIGLRIENKVKAKSKKKK